MGDKPKVELDPKSDAIVLEHVEGKPTAQYVPARDLHAGDLARIAYRRSLDAARSERSLLVAPGEDGPPEPERPERPNGHAIRRLFDELAASSAFKVATVKTSEDTPQPTPGTDLATDQPDQPASTDQPDAPAPAEA